MEGASPPDAELSETVVPRNSGRSFEVERGRSIRVRGRTIVDLVVFHLDDIAERFDQARTKTNQNTLYVTEGSVLYSKRNRVMMTITADTFEGRHDLQKGMCSRSRHELAFQKGMMRASYLRDVSWEQLPSHGCWENLSEAVRPYGIEPDDIPSPFNLFQHMDIDAETGRLTNTRVRPRGESGAYVTLRAEMRCLVALSACPDLSIGGQEVYVALW